jgi:hypothetical protein
MDRIHKCVQLLEAVQVNKKNGYLQLLHARQPVNADGSTCGITPKLDELLDGEDASQVFDRSAVLGMTALELRVSERVTGDPSNMGYADNIAVQVSFESTCATWILQLASTRS